MKKAMEGNTRKEIMSTETVLTDEQVNDLCEDWLHFFRGAPSGALFFRGAQSGALCVRAIEQSVLQSEQVRTWKRDAERYRALRAGLVGTDPDYGSRFCKYCDDMGIDQAKEITEEQFDSATDAAMEKQT